MRPGHPASASFPAAQRSAAVASPVSAALAPERVLLALSACVLVAEAAAWASCVWGNDEGILAALGSHVPPRVAIIPPLLLLAASAAKRAALPLATSLLALVIGVFPVGALAVHTRGEPRGRAISIVTYNVQKWAAGASGIARVLGAQLPDVFCLQEAGSYPWLHGPDEQPEALEAALPGYRIVRAGEVSIGTRLPLIEHRAVPLPGFDSRPLLTAVVRAGDGTEISVLTAHLLYNRAFGGTPAAVRAGASARLGQAEVIVAHAARLPRPVVLCGDLNAAPRSAAVRLLERTFEDAWSRRGAGFGTTMRLSLIPRRIDYVLVRGLDVVAAQVLVDEASDHRPVHAVLELR